MLRSSSINAGELVKLFRSKSDICISQEIIIDKMHILDWIIKLFDLEIKALVTIWIMYILLLNTPSLMQLLSHFYFHSQSYTAYG